MIDAVLPVMSVSTGYVREIGDAVRVGDIIKAKLKKIDKQFYDITIAEEGLGVIKAFCTRCRSKMQLKKDIYVCEQCGWKERRKLLTGSIGERRSDRPPRRGRYESKGFIKRKRFSRNRDARM